MNPPLKVTLDWTEYRDRGLRVPAKVLEGEVGSEVAVFDRNYVCTRHFVRRRRKGAVVIGPAQPWPEKVIDSRGKPGDLPRETDEHY